MYRCTANGRQEEIINGKKFWENVPVHLKRMKEEIMNGNKFWKNVSVHLKRKNEGIINGNLGECVRASKREEGRNHK